MRLLVSVRDAAEAAAAVAGGADIVDVKDPAHGALGAPAAGALAAVAAAVPLARGLSAALGEVADRTGLAAALALAGTPLPRPLDHAKLAPVGDAAWCETALRALVGRVGRSRAVAVAFADAAEGGTPRPLAVLAAAAAAGCAGFLVDTRLKDGRTLVDHLPLDDLGTLVRDAHAHDLWVAVAGSLDEPAVARLAARRPMTGEIVAVRTAACEGGRLGAIAAARVAGLRRLIGEGLPAPVHLE